MCQYRIKVNCCWSDSFLCGEPDEKDDNDEEDEETHDQVVHALAALVLEEKTHFLNNLPEVRKKIKKEDYKQLK